MHDQTTVLKTLPGTPRRKFLAALTGFFSAAIATLAAIPFVGTTIAPLRGGKAKSGAELVDVADIHDLEVDVPKRVEIVQRTVDAWTAHEATVLGAAWLIKRSSGVVEALSTVCPHLGCGVNFDHGAFKCPCHTSAFRLDGSVTGGPSPRGMDPLQVEVRNDRVFVRYVRYKQGTPQRELV